MKQDWLLVKDARRKVIRWWNPIAAFALIIGLLQVVFGRWSETEGWALFWLGVNILPGTILLHLNAWLNKYPEKIVPYGAYRSLLSLCVVFLLIALLTLLSVGLVIQMRDDWGHRDYLLQSFKWTIPLNLLLVAGIALIFYRRENVVRPNARIILDVVQRESQIARKEGCVQRMKCLQLLINNQMPAAFILLREFFPANSGSFDHTILLQGRFNNLQKMIDFQTIESDKAQMEINKIMVALLDLIKEINR